MMKVWIPTLLVLLSIGQAIRVVPVFANDHTPNKISPGTSSKHDLPAYRVEATDKLVITASAPVADPTFADQATVEGTYEVSADGTINLGPHGKLFVSGSTLIEIRNAVAEALSCDARSVDVHVFAYNSKKYYVVVKGLGSGDQVRRESVTGNETVLDAVATIGGLDSHRQVKMWLERAEKVNGPFAILPIEWSGICAGGDTRTNYPLLPGDRLFIVAEDRFQEPVLNPAKSRLTGRETTVVPTEQSKSSVATSAGAYPTPSTEAKLHGLFDDIGSQKRQCAIVSEKGLTMFSGTISDVLNGIRLVRLPFTVIMTDQIEQDPEILYGRQGWIVVFAKRGVVGVKTQSFRLNMHEKVLDLTDAKAEVKIYNDGPDNERIVSVSCKSLRIEIESMRLAASELGQMDFDPGPIP